MSTIRVSRQRLRGPAAPADCRRRAAAEQPPAPGQRRSCIVTTVTPFIHPGAESQPLVPAGSWRADPARSHVAFTARIAGRPLGGRLPLTGGVLITRPIEGSAARLTARTSALSTGSALLDRLLTGPGFLDAANFPEIGFRSELLVCVPTGWRAVG
jgi:polyisoprenoid-binding protein YceI